MKATSTRTNFGSSDFADDDADYESTIQISREALDARLLGERRSLSFDGPGIGERIAAVLEDKTVQWALVAFGVAIVFALAFFSSN